MKTKQIRPRHRANLRYLAAVALAGGIMIAAPVAATAVAPTDLLDTAQSTVQASGTPQSGDEVGIDTDGDDVFAAEDIDLDAAMTISPVDEGDPELGPDPDPEPGPDPTPEPGPDPEPGPNPDPDPEPGPDPTPNPEPGPTPGGGSTGSGGGTTGGSSSGSSSGGSSVGSSGGYWSGSQGGNGYGYGAAAGQGASYSGYSDYSGTQLAQTGAKTAALGLGGLLTAAGAGLMWMARRPQGRHAQ